MLNLANIYFCQLIHLLQENPNSFYFFFSLFNLFILVYPTSHLYWMPAHPKLYLKRGIILIMIRYQ